MKINNLLCVMILLACTYSYAKVDSTLYAQLSNQEKEWLVAHPQVSLGFTTGIPPYVISQGDSLSGIMIDIRDRIQQMIGINITLDIDHWGDIKQKAKERRIDGLLLATRKSSDKLDLILSNTFITTNVSVFIRSDSKFRINSLDDLAGKRIAYQQGTGPVEQVITRIPGKLKITKAVSSFVAIKLLMEKKVDVFVGLNSDNYSIVNSNLLGLQLEYMDIDTPVYGGTAIRDDWPEFVSIWNKGLEAIGNGELQKIKEKWSLLAINNSNTTPLNPEEEAWLRNHKNIRLGIDSYWPPFEYFDNEGVFQGLSSSYVQLINEQFHIEMNPIYKPTWDEVMKKAQAGDIDVLTAVMKSKKRSEYLNFTKPHTVFPLVILMREDALYVRGMEDLKGQKIATIKGYITEDYLNADFPEYNYHRFNTIEDALTALSEGGVDAFIGNTASISFTTAQLGLHNVKVVAPTEYKFKLSFGVRKDWPELIPILNKFIDFMPSHKKRAIEQSWLNLRVQKQTDWAAVLMWGLSIGSFFLIFLTVSFIWNRRLVKEITRRKLIEQKLALAKEGAENASRAKSMFLSNMSHEIRTPMNAILGFAEILDQKEVDPQKSTHIKTILTAGKSLLRLINNILDLSKIEAGKFEVHLVPISVATLLEEIKCVFKRTLKVKGLDIKTVVSDDVPGNLILDGDHLRQVVINLISNALKFTHSGEISIKVTAVHIKKEQQKSVNLIIEVKDTGIGIAPEELQKIFDPFEQSKYRNSSEYSGTGLGLAISSQLVKLMNGTLTVDSEYGKGSTFRVTVPGVEIHDIALLSEENQLPLNVSEIEFQEATILIVDDIEYNREMLSIYLEDMSFKLYHATNGHEALNQIHAHKPDLILLDMKMPGMDGYSLSQKIKHDVQFSDIPIIAITASALKEDRERIDQLCEGYLCKPVSKNELIEQMMRFLPYTETARFEPLKHTALDIENITSELFAGLSPVWLEEFSSAVDITDPGKCLSLINTLEAEFKSKAHALEILVNNFEFETLKDKVNQAHLLNREKDER